MTLHDISLSISEALIVWPGDPPLRITQPIHLNRGDSYTVSRLDISTHTGTHVDAPAHCIRGGLAVDALDLNVLVGPAQVVQALEADALSAAVLEGLAIPQGTERLLLRTRNSERWARGEREFATDFVALTEDGARWLVARGIRLVGVDYLSVGPFDDPLPTHLVLLGAGVIVVEGLNLSGVAPGLYQLVCLPLKIAGGDGAPARAILIDLTLLRNPDSIESAPDSKKQ
ncbi:MAG: cyclase family protein [Anaerolineae bacterium]|nr:cyclase family protein [Anaerolineae bacterium]